MQFFVEREGDTKVSFAYPDRKSSRSVPSHTIAWRDDGNGGREMVFWQGDCFRSQEELKTTARVNARTF